MKHITLPIILVLLLNHTLYPKKALIFGVNGQDGTFLTALLLKHGYEVHGVKQHTSHISPNLINHIQQLSNDNFFLHNGTVANQEDIDYLIRTINPDEIYNLAAQSKVKVSFDKPEHTANINALGTLRILEVIKKYDIHKKMRFYQASSSEMFGKTTKSPQNETTAFSPCSPYGAAKLFAHLLTQIYRNVYGIFACCGILFNHESPLRDEEFVTRKITKTVKRIAKGSSEILYLGNLDAKRDWGYAKDYVYAMWLILQQDNPDDYVIATGETHSIREFVELAFQEFGIIIIWQGTGINEVGLNAKTGCILVKIDPQYFRPIDIDKVLGDASKAHAILHWRPTTSFKQLIKIMINEDIDMIYT